MKAMSFSDQGFSMVITLITGGPGFIGSHLVIALVARGDRVRVLDNPSSGSEANLDSRLSS